jgi:hypothetical protein
MSDADTSTRKRVLEPIDRVSEILFGLIMVLTFTGSLSVAESGREDVRAMLIGAIGCNLAWGLIDALMYLMGSLTERARGRMAWQALRSAGTTDDARSAIADALPSAVASAMSDSELDSMRQRLSQAPEPPQTRLLTADDWRGALGVFLLVFLSTFPVVLPFVFMRDAWTAMRASNGIAIVMLFVCGWSWARFTGMRPWLVGSIMVLVGSVLAALTLALGG